MLELVCVEVEVLDQREISLEVSCLDEDVSLDRFGNFLLAHAVGVT